MANKKKRLSVWGILARLGHRGDHDDIIQHVFDATSRVTLRSHDGRPLDGDDFLCGVFDRLGTSRSWPPCGSAAWVRLRLAPVRPVAARLGTEGVRVCVPALSASMP